MKMKMKHHIMNRTTACQIGQWFIDLNRQDLADDFTEEYWETRRYQCETVFITAIQKIRELEVKKNEIYKN